MRRSASSGLEEARAAPGVRVVWTAADITDLGPLPCAALLKQYDGTRIKPTEHLLLARDMVRHVGDPIAFIVAESLSEARDAPR